MSPRKPAPETAPETEKEPDDRGIVYHGDEWDEETAESEHERGMVTNTDDEVVDVDEEDDVEGHHDGERVAPDDDVK
jgi:hypothetical protein